METLVHAATTYPNPKQVNGNGFSLNRNASLSFANGYSFHRPFNSQKLSLGFRKSVIAGAKKNKNKIKNKEDAHSFIPRPHEATGPFPEAVLLKEKKVQEDGKLLPEFADAEEQKLYEFLNLELEKELNVERLRHYEVVYLIHEKHAEEVGSVNEKIQGQRKLSMCRSHGTISKNLKEALLPFFQSLNNLQVTEDKDFLGEKRAKIWRLSDWGMRRLAYKIKKATNAHYILMNFEMEAKWINDFKTMLDKDGRVIRHLVIKRDEAITEDCPPSPEFHTLRAGMDDNDEDDDDLDYDDDDEASDEDWDGEGDMEGYDDGEDGIIVIDSNDNDVDDDDGSEDWMNKSELVNDKGRRNKIREMVGR